MNKKLLGITLLSMSVMTFSACSSDDDDGDTVIDQVEDVVGGDTDVDGGDTDVDGGTDTDTGAGAGDVTPPPTDGGDVTPPPTDGGDVTPPPTDGGDVTPPPTDGGDAGGGGGSGSDPADLEGSLTAAGASAAFGLLRNEGLLIAASEASWTIFIPTDEAVNAFGGTPNVFAHIYDVAALSSTDLTGLVGSSISMNSNGGSPSVEIAGGGTGPLTIGGHTVTMADVNGGSSVIHIINGVIPEGP